MADTRDIFQLNLARYLGLSELAKLQAVDAVRREMLSNGALWHECFSAERPDLGIAPELFRPESRPTLVRHLPPLLAANAVVPVSISSLEEAGRLAKLAGGAQRAASTHVACGRGAACAAVGRLRFPRETISRAMEASATERDVCCGEPITFRVSEELAQALCVPGGLLEVQFGWQGRSLLVRLQEPGARGPGRGRGRGRGHGPQRTALVDLSVQHPSLTVHQRGAVAELGGSWRPMSNGLTATSQGKAAACASLADGLLCAVCLREDGPEAAGLCSRKVLVQALHLDRIRTTSS